MRSVPSARDVGRGHPDDGEVERWRAAAPQDFSSGCHQRSSAVERGPARQLLSRHGHWILAALLVILFIRLNGYENAPLPVRVPDITVGDVPDARVAVPSEVVQGVSDPAPERVSADVSSAVAIVPDEAERSSDLARERGPETISLIIEPAENGAYYLRGTINHQDVIFLVDTGASSIAIPERLRHLLKLARGRYVPVNTASGVVGNYETVIEHLTVGPLQFRNIAGMLNPHAPNEVLLLGMNALKDIRMLQSDGHLTLTQQQSPATETAQSPATSAPLKLRRPLRECSQPGLVIDRRTLECMEGR